MAIGERFKNAWNAFMGRDPTFKLPVGGFGSYRPDRKRLINGHDRNIVNTIYNQIAVDCASIDIKHVRVDKEGKYLDTIDSDLNYALNVSANIDQTGVALIQDIVMSMLDEGCVAVVPIDTDINPANTDSYKIYTLRVGKIVEWFPYDIRVELYRESTGTRESIIVPKRICAIIENPFYSIMNEPNSNCQRLIRTLNQLDRFNEDNQPGKLNMIIQLPYVIKSKAREIQARHRRKEIEQQLVESRHGIAYADGTERIVQLNRPLENTLWEQVEGLQKQLHNQLGLTQAIFDGTADEQVQLNYHNRTIAPILTAVVKEMDRKWITRTARTQGQAIRFFRDPFKLVPVNQVAEIGDKFTRNEIMTSNEFRSILGMKPSSDPKANELRNANLNHPDEEGTTSTVVDEVIEE